MCPSTIGEVVQWQVASSNPEMESLPFGIAGSTDPSIKVGSIILMDGVAVDAA